jgi:hypothetical protein
LSVGAALGAHILSLLVTIVSLLIAAWMPSYAAVRSSSEEFGLA